MPSPSRNEVLARIVAWGEASVRDRLSRKPDLDFDVPLLITELADLEVCSLFSTLVEDLGEQGLHEFLLYLLAEDPSLATPEGALMERLFAEKPFPRYVVALVYLMVMDCSEHDFRALTESIWSNILAGRHHFWPELLTAVLVRLEPTEILLERAVLLAASEIEHERFIGENLLYGLPIRREVLRQRLKQASDSEADPVKVRRYKDLYKRYRWS